MNLLVDTHVLLWSAFQSRSLSRKALALLEAPENRLWYSAASLWEVAIKRALNRPDFRVEVSVLRAGLLSNGYSELAIEGRHCLALSTLPEIHRDPFDRILIAQAVTEGMTLLTADQVVAQYAGPIEVV